MNNVLNVEELFSNRLFVVPDYQRGYAWEQRHWNDFLEDLELLPDGKDHFTGTVVLHEDRTCQRTDETGKKYAHFNIVDGQQRLTTIVLLLDAIRHSLFDVPKLATLMSGIQASYLHVKDLNGERMFKLTLNRDCHSFFVNNILEDPPGPEGPMIASHQRLRDAKRHFRAYLARQSPGGSKEQDAARLVQLHDKVTHRLRLSLYTVNEASDVGVIFEVMNNRGKLLSELEKVKNYLLYAGSKLDLPDHTLADSVNQTWTNIFERLMAADLSDTKDEDQLLRMHWLMAYDHRSRNFTGSNSVKSHFRLRDYLHDHKGLLASLHDYTKTLDQASLAYCDIVQPSRSDSFGSFRSTPTIRDAIVHRSQKLERINVVATFLPVLMAVRLRFPESGDKYIETLTMCELFAFRVYRLLERRSDAGQKTIFRVAKELFDRSITFDDAMRALRAELLAYCPQHVFAEHFKMQEEENNWYGWSGLKYLLYEYEEHLARRHAVQLPWNTVARRKLEQTIEHILPQTAVDPYWTARFDGKEVRRLVHDLGNLCLTQDNATYGNKPFGEKKGRPGDGRACYANSSLFQERELAAEEEWTPEAVVRRRERLVGWALQRWHVDESGVTPAVPQSLDEEDDES